MMSLKKKLSDIYRFGKIYQPSTYYHPIWGFSTFSNWWMCPEIWQFLELRNNFVYDYKDENVHIFTKILLILRKFTLKFTFEVVNIYFVFCCFKGIYSAFSPSAIKAKARINPKWPLTFPNNKADYLEDWGSSQTMGEDR